MLLDFDILKDSFNEDILIIFERGEYEKPIVMIRKRDIRRMKDVIDKHFTLK